MKNSTALINSFFSTNTETDVRAATKEQARGHWSIVFFRLSSACYIFKNSSSFLAYPNDNANFCCLYNRNVLWFFFSIIYINFLPFIRGNWGTCFCKRRRFVIFIRSHSWIFIWDGFSSSSNWIFR